VTLLSTIIRDAFRESNLIAISADPTAAEQEEGLRLLNRLILSLFGYEAGDPLTTLPLGSNNVSRPVGFADNLPNDWHLPANTRLVLNITSPQTVYFHPKPEDGARMSIIDKSGNLSTNPLTIAGNGYTIEGQTSVTLNTDNVANEYFFRADTGNWSLVSPLTVDDESPFPEQFDDLLIIGLAMRLNPRNGVAVDAQSAEAYRNNLKKFRAKYRQTVHTPVEDALLSASGTMYHYYYSDTDTFTSGYVR